MDGLSSLFFWWHIIIQAKCKETNNSTIVKLHFVRSNTRRELNLEPYLIYKQFQPIFASLRKQFSMLMYKAELCRCCANAKIFLPLANPICQMKVFLLFFSASFHVLTTRKLPMKKLLSTRKPAKKWCGSFGKLSSHVRIALRTSTFSKLVPD